MRKPLAALPVMRHELRTVLRTWGACVVVGIVLLPILVIQPWRTYLDQGPIRSDGLGYFAWTRAALDGDLGFCRYPSVEAVAAVKIPRPTDEDPAAMRCSNKYPPGLAILQFPVMAALSSRSDTTMAVTPAQHEASIWLGGLALLGTCIAVTAIARRLGAEGWGVQVAIVAFVFGAGLFPYATYAASFVHVHAALLVSLLIYAAVRTHQEGRRLGTAMVIGLCGFFIVSMRFIDLAIVAILAAAYALWSLATIDATSDRWTHVRRIALDLMPLVAGVLGAAGLQLIINHYMAGTWTFSSYRSGEDFIFDQAHQREVLFSYDRGLFVYAPVVLLTLVGGVFVSRARIMTAIYGTLIAALTLIYGFWFQWQLGGGAGFGHRGFIEIAPVGMLVAAIILTSIPHIRRFVFGGLALGAALWSLQLAVLMWSNNYPEYTANAHIYWSHTIGSESVLARLFP